MPNRNKFSKQQKIDILQHYLLNSMSPVNTLRSLRRLWNDRFLYIKGTTFRHLLDIFRRHGAVEYQRKREHTARTPKNIERVKEIVGEASEEQRPSSSYRIAAQVGVSQSTVWRILRKDLKLKPYHIKLVHKLNEDDFDRRVEFSEILLDRHSSDDSILDRIIWTDEATFSLSNTINRHNCVY
jgi:hypothetical protein